MNFFTVKYDNNISFTDLSMKLKDYGTPAGVLTLLATQYLYVGNYKPFNNMYIELLQPNISSGDLKAEYFNGATWEPLEIVDETYNFSEHGFIRFNAPEDWSSTEVDGDAKFWIRYQPTQNQTLVGLNGLAIVFSNDQDIIAQRSNIVSKHNNGKSWILKHEEARKEIIGRLRRLGHIKVKERSESNLNSKLFFGNGKTDLLYIDITEFDILDIDQLREASKLKTLELIYLNELTDEPDDKYERQGKRYAKKFEEAMSLFFLKLDLDDDGKVDAADNNYNTTTNLIYN